ncbi:acyltransferase [Variovorax sp. V213]|uniref:acyltransferase family protein n=1 Tax=Variovorax sp. V213 TaxID=3065955 RepID=UPI0034E8E561
MKSQSIAVDQPQYVESIQAGRGIAALLVVIHHAAQKAHALSGGAIPLFDFGIIGVDVFFMISGFIIYFVTANKTMTHVEFMEKRIVRVFPLYWGLSLLALLVFIFAPKLINSNSQEATDVAASFFLWPTSAPYLVNNGWTLTYEIIFYGLWALVALPVAKPRSAYIACLVLAAASFIGVLCGIDYKVMNFSLFVEFAFGVAIGVAFKKGLLRQSIPLSIVLTTAGAFLAYLAISRGFGSSELRGFALAIPSAMIFVGIILLGSVWGKARTILAIGDSSYSLYLFHPFILVAIPLTVKSLGLASPSQILAIAAAVCVASFWASHMVYRYVEFPLTQMMRGMIKSAKSLGAARAR